jgi:phenylpropionate dioxygenase-like ring-hydroxylating dioxygenase large terminal subunit
MSDWDIDEDIRNASTLPGRFYSDPDVFRKVRDRIFSRTWHPVGDADQLRVPGKVLPTTLLEGSLDEPLLLVRDERDEIRCLSNVCTHRGNLVCEGEGVEKGLRCRYHGRRFGLDGRFQSMPEFEGARGFPSAADDLPRVPLGRWGKFLFASLDPAVPFASVLADWDARLGWLPLDRAALDPSRSREYVVQANWALYCDNYLEGFHIPFVHAALNQALDTAAYRTELFAHSSLQVGPATGDDDAFAPPASSPDRGQKIAGYYLWIFPSTMFNFYPWGVSVNLVQPLAVDRTRVAYLTYVWDPSKLDRGAGANLDRVEREDEAVVESVQKGIRSRLYRRGRYSPSRETGVHHFHRLVARFLNG